MRVFGMGGTLFPIVIVVLGLSCFRTGEEERLLWERTFGGSGDDIGEGIVVEGNDCVIVGHTTSFGSGGADVYLLKVDSEGKLIWSRTLGDSGDDYGYAIDRRPGGGYFITGAITVFDSVPHQDVFVARLTSSGDTVWTRRYGGARNDVGCSIVTLDDGSAVIAGYTESFSDGKDIYLLKVKSCGDTVWTRTYNESDEDKAYGIATTPDGGFIVTGKSDGDIYLLRVDGSGGRIWSQHYGGGWSDEGRDVVSTQDGYLVVGKDTRGELWPTTKRLCLLKTDGSGNSSWLKLYGSDYTDSKGYAMAKSEEGYILVGRYGQSNENIIVVEVGEDGGELWDEYYGGEGGERGHDVAKAGDGYLVVGYTTSYGSGGADVYLLKIEP